MKAGRIVLLVFGCLIGLLGLGLLIGGIAATVAYGVARDGDGFFRSDEISLVSASSAIISDSVDLNGGPADIGWLSERGDIGTVSVEIRPVTAGEEVFAGIGPTADVENYLASVAVDQVEDIEDNVARLVPQEGTETPAPPVDQTFWVAQIATAETGSMTWDIERGDWSIVVMNADGSPGVDVESRVGIKLDWLLAVAIGLIIAGVILLAGGTTMAVLAARGPRRPLPPVYPPGGQPTMATTPAGTPPPPPPTGPAPTSQPHPLPTQPQGPTPPPGATPPP
ncbi:MAG: hypothetical protein ACRDZ2_10595 [Ilumatobacteraceae bacterium]